MRDNITEQPNSPSDDASLDAQFPAEVAALRESGARWRATHAPAAERAERRAHDSLHAWLAATPEIESSPREARRRERRARWRPFRLAISLVALAAVVTLAAYGVTRLVQPTHWVSSPAVPPPQMFVWNTSATLGSQTPQQAYAAAMTLTPCVGGPGSTFGHGGPPRSATVTWLAAGPNYGLVRIQPVCGPSARPIHLWLFTIVRYDDRWIMQQGEIEGNWSAKDQRITPPPAWLPLPADTYAEERVAGPQGVVPPDSVVAWDAQARLFVFGHVADSAIRPSGATSVVVDGHRGWVTTENDMTTVTVTLDDGSTLFFSGTTSPAQTQTLAADAFPHMNEVLENLRYPTVTPSGAAGLNG